ncbi:hypothetical protein [Umezawaea beigongshangensis]|uniref:hypothetical protein n=1 Tax=Umezawaea beigongshangensis TaxID=2780383 RepID=UPI0018F14BA0|nr:hypothetical protein [Umezawaea beigongshangensis]
MTTGLDPLDFTLTCITPACARRRHGARLALSGSRVCGWCREELRNALTEVPDLWDDLDDPELLFGRKGEPIRRPPGIAAGAPLDLTYLALRDPRSVWVEPGDLIHPLDALGGYRVLLLDALAGRASPPVVDGRRVFYRRGGGGSVAVVCRAIAAHDDLALRQQWAGWLCWAVRLVRDELRSLTGAERTWPVGHCPEVYEVGDADLLCDYPLWYPMVGDLECGGCGAVWPRRKWLALAEQMEVRSR